MTRLGYVGHGAVLLEMDGATVLTDPAARRWLGPLRRVGPLPGTEALRGASIVLITHLHIDHLDLPTLRMLGGAPTILVPEHGVALLRHHGFSQVVGMAQGETRHLGPVSVTATAALHSGRRRPGSPEGDAVGYVVRGSNSVYVAGDTGLFAEMSEIGPDLDVACLPIDGWGLTLPDDHLSPLTAAQALALLKPRVVVPIHWGTYYLPGLPLLRNPLQQPQAFRRYATHLAPAVEVRILNPGEWLDIAEAAAAS